MIRWSYTSPIYLNPGAAGILEVLEAMSVSGYLPALKPPVSDADHAADFIPKDVIARVVTMIGGIPNVDILTRAWNVLWVEATLRATVFHVEGVQIPTASIEDLIASKQTGRLQDAADIEVLEEIRRFRSQ